MIRVVLLLLSLLAVIPLQALAAGDIARVELNAAENENGKCRVTFVIENKTDKAIDSLKLDLVAFDPDGIVYKRLPVEMGPVRAAKTMVRIYLVEGECSHIGAILVNDVTGCAPADATTCL